MTDETENATSKLDRLERAKAKLAKAQAQLARIERAEKVQAKASENKKKYVIGGYVLTQMAEGKPVNLDPATFSAWLDANLWRDQDRKAFGLAPRPAKTEEPARAATGLTPAQPSKAAQFLADGLGQPDKPQ